MKRLDYIDWNTAYIAIATIFAWRSKDPNTQCGAFIVDENMKPVSGGYNGFPHKCNDDDFPWSSPEKYDYVIHAELNAIFNDRGHNLDGCTLFLFSDKGFYPCCECAKAIIQNNIKKIVLAYFSKENTTHKYNTDSVDRMFQSAGVEIQTLYDIKERFITIRDKFDHIIKTLEKENKLERNQ